MTQMLLFDSAAAAPAQDTTVAVPAAAVKDATSRMDVTPKSEDPQNIAAAIEHDGGLNHMGDLARLVLLRYELVAKRRAAMAARKTRKEN